MPLNLNDLENLVALPDGSHRARCPACKEKGHDRTGEHLMVRPDGRFGCCAFPEDKFHRRRIYALAAGQEERIAIEIRPVTPSDNTPFKTDIIQRIERLFPRQRPTNGVECVDQTKDENGDSRTSRTGSLISLREEGVGGNNITVYVQGVSGGASVSSADPPEEAFRLTRTSSEPPTAFETAMIENARSSGKTSFTSYGNWGIGSSPQPLPRTPPWSPLERLQAVLGEGVYFVPTFPGETSKLRHYTKERFADTKKPAYLEQFRFADVCILLGEASGGLCAVEMSSKTATKAFLVANPRMAATTRTNYLRTSTFWFRIQGEPPPSTAPARKPFAWLADGRLAVIARYESVLDAEILTPILLSFAEIRWPKRWLLPWPGEDPDWFEGMESLREAPSLT